MKLNWKKPKGAVKYMIFGSKCGTKNKYKKIATTAKPNFTVKKVAGKKLKAGTYYKFIVVALNKNKNVVSSSKVAHVATKGGKVTNPVKVTVTKKVLKKAAALTVGKTVKLKAKLTKPKKGVVRNHAAIRYQSSNKAVATVSKKGVVKGIKPGTAKVYCYAQNGACKVVKVKVKAKAKTSTSAKLLTTSVR